MSAPRELKPRETVDAVRLTLPTGPSRWEIEPMGIARFLGFVIVFYAVHCAWGFGTLLVTPVQVFEHLVALALQSPVAFGLLSGIAGLIALVLGEVLAVPLGALVEQQSAVWEAIGGWLSRRPIELRITPRDLEITWPMLDKTVPLDEIAEVDVAFDTLTLVLRDRSRVEIRWTHASWESKNWLAGRIRRLSTTAADRAGTEQDVPKELRRLTERT